jgi:hypothetical protein
MNKEVLEEKVYYYTNVFDDLQKLMNAVEESSPNWEEWTACSGEHYIYGTGKTIVSSTGNIDGEINDYIFNTINDAFQKVAKDYAMSMGDNSDPKLFPAFPIKKYMAGTFMGAHFDQQEGDERLKYSLVMYLNDNYEGGEISFTIKDPNGPIKSGTPAADFTNADSETYSFAIKPKAGSIIIFPPSPPYHHTAHLVKSGFKYMVPQHWIHNNIELNRNQSM